MTEKSFPEWTRGKEDTINDVFRRANRDHRDRFFLDVDGQRFTYGEAHTATCRLANGLLALGVKKGDTVVTLLDNSAEAVFIWLAINKLGAISVPVNTAYKGDFLRHQANDAEAAIIIAESDYAERVVQVADGLPALRTLVHRGERAASLDGFKGTVLPWVALESDDTSDPDVPVKPGDLAMLIYTGGTTGPSKGCMVSHNYTCNLSRQILAAQGRTKDSITWTPLPLFHLNAVTATLLSSMLVGGGAAVYSRFSVSNFWPEVERVKATDVSLLGSMIVLLARADDNEAMLRYKGKLRAIWAAPFPDALRQVFKDRFGIQYVYPAAGFGLTECSLVTHIAFEDYPTAKPGSSGKHCEWFDVRIVDDDDNEVPVGQPGEIVVRPRQPHVMFEGYWKRPADTLKVMRNMWFHTGDIGKFDEDGFFYFVDRKKDYLRRKGENISSMEVENALRAHPAIEDVAAHAVLSELAEDELKITVKLKGDMQLVEVDLFHWCVERMPYFAVPRYIEFRDELPKSPVGRILKYQLRDEGVTPKTWDQERAGIKFAKR